MCGDTKSISHSIQKHYDIAVSGKETHCTYNMYRLNQDSMQTVATCSSKTVASTLQGIITQKNTLNMVLTVGIQKREIKS